MSQALDQVLVRSLHPYTNAGHAILNLPSGHGELSRELEKQGGQVTSADLFPEFSKYRPEDVVKADMNQPLPFESGSFDAIVCQEGVEHLENVPSFLAECRRVLKNGGRLFITTPNYLDLSSRLSFFLTGLKGFRSHYPNEESSIWGIAVGRVYHGHAFTLPFFQIRYLLRINQFDSIQLNGVKRSATSSILYWIMRPIIPVLSALLTRRRIRRDRKNGYPTVSQPLQQELHGFATSKDLLMSKTILVESRLSEGSFQPSVRFAFD
jgi:2-polyprenyl-3-methyl-5-hydroxy-6-metoxy-1,4-benzoquinol methylase